MLRKLTRFFAVVVVVVKVLVTEYLELFVSVHLYSICQQYNQSGILDTVPSFFNFNGHNSKLKQTKRKYFKN